MKKIKTILILLLYLILILPATIVKAGEVNVSDYNELKDAIENSDEATIVLSDNITVTEDPGLNITSGKNITLDLNGYTISMESTAAKTSYLINNNGSLTVKDSTDTSKNGTGTGKITYLSTIPSANYSYASNTINNRGKFVLESGLIENNTSPGYAVYCIDNYSNNSTITVNGGKIYSLKSWGIRMFVTSSTLGNDVIINGGTIEGGMWLQVANSNPPKASIIINGGTIYGNSRGLYVYDGSTNDSNITVKINGGKIGANKEGGQALYIYDTNANVEINNGTFTGEYALIYFTYDKANSASNVINNGTFNGYVEVNQKFTTNPEENYDSNVCINNGKFSTDVYAWAYDGANWYLSKNTQFIKNGYFATIVDGEDDCCWPEHVVGPYQATGKMISTPAGYPYSIGYKVTLNANYEGKEDEAVYTLKDGVMTELKDGARNGYKFLGWNTKQDGTGETITSKSVINESKTLYAQWELVPGDVETKVESDEHIEIQTDLEELNNTVLTEEEKQIVSQGKNIKLEVIVKDVSENISEDVKEIIEKEMGDKKIGAYIDISILKTIEGEEPIYLSNTSNKLKFTIDIPEELIDKENKNREYYIVRIHDGKVEILDTIYDEENNTLTFETDKFSTYAIAYTDEAKVETKGETAIAKNPKTGDDITLSIVMMSIAVIGIAVTIKIRKK